METPVSTQIGISFTLTPEGASKTGAVMSDATIDLHSDFDISFNFFLGSTDGGSNGATFVLQSDPNGSSASGSGGAGLGASGIKNGLAIAFNAKIGAETTSLVDTDAGSSLKALTPAVSLGNLEDGHWHQAHVVWDAETSTLTVLGRWKARRHAFWGPGYEILWRIGSRPFRIHRCNGHRWQH